jgi:hypothetical protein
MDAFGLSSMTAAFDQRISLLEAEILNPKTPEEERLADLHIANECERIRQERDQLYATGDRIGNKARRRIEGHVEASTFRMPRVFKVSMGRDSSNYLGGN